MEKLRSFSDWYDIIHTAHTIECLAFNNTTSCVSMDIFMDISLFYANILYTFEMFLFLLRLKVKEVIKILNSGCIFVKSPADLARLHKNPVEIPA